MRQEDTVARIGGDEFTILLEGLTDDNCAFRAAERLQEALSKPVLLGSHRVRTTGSVGIALSEGARRTAEELLRDADLAMYRAKKSGGGRLLGCEAPMRWRHPEDGLVPPLGFIPLAEETGFIRQMGPGRCDGVGWDWLTSGCPSTCRPGSFAKKTCTRW